MSTFWKTTFGTLAEIVSVPANVVISTIDALDSNKTFQEVYKENEIEFKEFINDAEEFGNNQGHMINHGIIHIAKHMLGGK